MTNNMMKPRPGESAESFTARVEFAAETMGRIVKIRKAKKAVEFYDDYWINRFVSPQGRVHAKFRQAGTATLRFSSSDPNFQQWPRDMRQCIGGEEGMTIVASDYKQIEVVIAAELAGDQKLLSLIARGGDIHTMVAAQALKIPEHNVTSKQRKAFKAGNFCFIFGGTPETFRDYALSFGADLTMAEAQQIHDLYFSEFEGLRKWKERAIEVVQDKSRQVVEIRLRSGGVRHLLRREGTLKSTTILNTNVQGTAAAGMKFAILECKKAGLDIFFGATVHDELVACVPTRHAQAYAEALQAAMVRGMAKVLRTPANTDLHVANFWG
jgi:DNA polymerase-1